MMGPFAGGLIGHLGEHMHLVSEYSGLKTSRSSLWFHAKQGFHGFGHPSVTGEVWRVQRVIDAVLWNVEATVRLKRSQQRVGDLLSAIATVPQGQAVNNTLPVPILARHSEQSQQPQWQSWQAHRDKREWRSSTTVSAASASTALPTLASPRVGEAARLPALH